MSSKVKKTITESQAKELAESAEEVDLSQDEVELNLRTIEFVKVVPDNYSGLPETFMIGKTKHFRNGNYELVEDNIGIKGNVYEFYDIVSAQFHQLKGKLFNLVETIGLSNTQEKAVKGLIKDFCNSKYKNTTEDLEAWVTRMGFYIGALDSTRGSVDPLRFNEEDR